MSDPRAPPTGTRGTAVAGLTVRVFSTFTGLRRNLAMRLRWPSVQVFLAIAAMVATFAVVSAETWTLRWGAGAIRQIAVSSDGDLVALATENGALEVRRLSRSSPTLGFRRGEGPLAALAFVRLPEGEALVYVTSLGGLHIERPASGRPIRVPALEGGGLRILDVQTAPDGALWLIGVDDTRVVVARMGPGGASVYGAVGGRDPYFVETAPREIGVALRDANGATVSIVEPDQGDLREQRLTVPQAGLLDLAIPFSGHRAVAPTGTVIVDTTGRALQQSPSREIGEFSAKRVRGLAFCEGGARLVTVEPRAVVLRSVNALHRDIRIALPSTLDPNGMVACSSDGRHITVGGAGGVQVTVDDGTVQPATIPQSPSGRLRYAGATLVNDAPSSIVMRGPVNAEAARAIRNGVLTPNATSVAAATPGGLVVFDAPFTTPRLEIRSGRPRLLALSDDGRLLALVSEQGRGAIAVVAPCAGSRATLAAGRVDAPDARGDSDFWTVAADGAICRLGRAAGDQARDDAVGPLTAAASDGVGRAILGVEDGGVVLYDVRRARATARYPRTRSAVTAIARSPDGRLAIVGGANGDVRVIRLRGLRPYGLFNQTLLAPTVLRVRATLDGMTARPIDRLPPPRPRGDMLQAPRNDGTPRPPTTIALAPSGLTSTLEGQATSTSQNPCLSLPTPRERLVCGYPALALQARRLQSAYEQAIANGGDVVSLERSQAEWRRMSETVATRASLAEAYDRRTRELEALGPSTVAPATSPAPTATTPDAPH